MHPSKTTTRTLSFLIGLIWMLSPLAIHANGDGGHGHGQDAAPDAEVSDNSAYELSLETHPEASEIIPDGDPAELIIKVHKGKQLAENIELSYRVYAPEKSLWFGTDFPVVEGTQLLGGTVFLPDGQQVIQAVLPIRGTYRVNATVRGPEGTTSQTFSFDVTENPSEVRNLGLFLLVLFLVGGAGGFLFSRTKTPGSSATAIGLVAAGLLILFSGQPAQAHGGGSWDPDQLENRRGVTTFSEGATIETKLFPQPVKVGEMVRVRYHIDPGNQQEKSSPVQVESHFVHSEGGLEMIRQNHWLEEGSGEIRAQLFDGADHYLVSRFYRSESNQGDGHDHDHADENEQPSAAWEAETTYTLAAGRYDIHFEESGDPAMKWQLVRGDHPSDRTRHGLFGQCETVTPGSTIPADAGCYNLELEPDGTEFTLEVDESGAYTLFTEHLPREFNMQVVNEQGPAEITRKQLPGKGEYLGQSVRRIAVTPISPPPGSIAKALITLLFITGLGTWIGFRLPGWLGGSGRE